jgi:hypothetical protein
VRTLIAHEPPLTQVLADPEPFVQTQLAVERAFREEGVAAALGRFLAFTGIDPADREDDAPLPRPGPQRAANLEFFLTHDAPAARRFRLYLDPLVAEPKKIIPAMGEGSRQRPHAEPVQALARLLGRECAEFPGGHSGHVFRPRAFAAKLRQALDHH